MAGYNFTKHTALNWTPIFCGAVKNGNKITFVAFGTYTPTGAETDARIGSFGTPSDVGSKIYPYEIGSSPDNVDNKVVPFFSDRTNYVSLPMEFIKVSNNRFDCYIRNVSTLTANTTYFFRYEVTFLLSDNLAQ